MRWWIVLVLVAVPAWGQTDEKDWDRRRELHTEVGALERQLAEVQRRDVPMVLFHRDELTGHEVYLPDAEAASVKRIEANRLRKRIGELRRDIRLIEQRHKNRHEALDRQLSSLDDAAIITVADQAPEVPGAIALVGCEPASDDPAVVRMLSQGVALRRQELERVQAEVLRCREALAVWRDKQLTSTLSDEQKMALLNDKSALARLEGRLVALEHSPVVYVPTLDCASLDVGLIGWLRDKCRVVDVLDDTQLLVAKGSTFLWIDGFATAGLVDGMALPLSGFVEVVGVRQYRTPLGTTNTVHHVAAADLDRFLRRRGSEDLTYVDAPRSSENALPLRPVTDDPPDAPAPLRPKE